MKRPKGASLIGLAMKAGKVASGEFASERSLRQGMGCLVVISEDASDNTYKKFRDLASGYDIPVCRYLNKVDLGWCIGKGERSSLVITDPGFARSIEEAIQKENGNQQER